MGETRPPAILESEHLQAQPVRPRDVDEGLARVLPRMKDAETVRQSGGLQLVDLAHPQLAPIPRNLDREAARPLLEPLVVERPLNLDPLGFLQLGAEIAGCFDPV